MFPHPNKLSCLAVALTVSVFGQTNQPAVMPTVETLKIRILEGSGAVNNTTTGLYLPIVVEVRDSNETPVEGATVTFELPASGPGGVFAEGKMTYVSRTNFQGQAMSQGFQPNNQQGSFQLKVTAVLGRQSGRATVRQSNSTQDFGAEKPKVGIWKPTKKKIFILTAVGGGVATWLVLRNRGNSTTAITLSPGPVVFGPPR